MNELAIFGTDISGRRIYQFPGQRYKGLTGDGGPQKTGDGRDRDVGATGLNL
jgi:hypothetical protein